MKLFVLIATLYANDGSESYYAIHSGIEGKDCIESMVQLQPFMASNVVLSCSFDTAYDLPIDAE